MLTEVHLLQLADGVGVGCCLLLFPLLWRAKRRDRKAGEHLEVMRQLQQQMLYPPMTPKWHETFTAMAADVELKPAIATQGRMLADAVRQDFPNWPDLFLATVLARVLQMAQAAERQAPDRAAAWVMLTDLIEAAAVDLSAADREFGS